MNSTIGPYFKVVFLKKKKKVFAGPVNSTRDPQKILMKESVVVSTN